MVFELVQSPQKCFASGSHVTIGRLPKHSEILQWLSLLPARNLDETTSRGDEHQQPNQSNYLTREEMTRRGYEPQHPNQSNYLTREDFVLLTTLPC